MTIPEGWAAAKLGELLEPGGLFDGPFGSSLKTSDYTDAGTRVIRLENIANLQFVEEKRTFISHEKYETLRKHAVGKDDVIVGSFVDGAVRVCVLPELSTKAIAKADCFCVRTRAELDRRFLAYQLGTNDTRDALVEEIHGATRPRITTRQLREFEILVAPVAEQRRVVEKVEALLAVINAARDRLAKVPAILKRFRQSVLAAACSGRLTEEWRSNQRYSESWIPVTIRELSERVTSGSRAWSRYYEDDADATFVMAQNVRPMLFNQGTRQGINPPGNDPEMERTRVSKDDILVTIVGANTGDVCRVPFAVSKHFVCQSVALVRLRDPSNSRFVELWLNSMEHGQGRFLDLMYGEGRPHLSLEQIRDIEIMLPSTGEQEEIVRRVAALWNVCDGVEQRVASATARGDKLSHAVLAKAIRGELVPTEAELARQENREYEPASVLLERIRASREDPGESAESRKERGAGARQRRANVSVGEAAAKEAGAGGEGETNRGGDGAVAVHASEVAPAAGDNGALPQFAELDPDEQGEVVWITLFGHGALSRDDAVRTAAAQLKGTGVLAFQKLRSDGPVYEAIDAAIQRGLKDGVFDRPGRGRVRAVKRDAKAYTAADWRTVLVSALAEGEVVERDEAIEGAAAWATETCGLEFARLRRDGVIWNGLRAALEEALTAGAVERVDARTVRLAEPADGAARIAQRA